MEVLPRLLPRSDTQISTLINMVRMESGNGFDLLWRVMALSVPGFDPTRQVTIPVWDDADIFDFALSFLLYFRLLAKKGVVQDDRTNSFSFLNAITEPAYADAITTLMTCITNYASGLDDGYLPPKWVWRLNCIRMHEPVHMRWFLGCAVHWECMWAKGNAVAAFRVLRGLHGWRTTALHTVIIVLVVGVHIWVLRARLYRVAEAMDVRDALHLLVGVSHALTGMTVPIARTRYAMRVVARGMSRQTAMSLRLHCSLRNTKETYRMMSKTKLNRNGWRVGVRLSEIRNETHGG